MSKTYRHPGEGGLFEVEGTFPTGHQVSLTDPAFGPIVGEIDNKMRRALRIMLDSRQNSACVTAKITFERTGGGFRVKHETGFQIDQPKVKDKGELFEEIEIVQDESGNPIIPDDRQHQMTLEETAPMITTVDGNSGLVEDVQIASEIGETENVEENHPYFAEETEEE